MQTKSIFICCLLFLNIKLDETIYVNTFETFPAHFNNTMIILIMVIILDTIIMIIHFHAVTSIMNLNLNISEKLTVCFERNVFSQMDFGCNHIPLDCREVVCVLYHVLTVGSALFLSCMNSQRRSLAGTQRQMSA